jgi:hypothetical protein
LNPDLRCIALGTKRRAVFDLRAALGTSMLHKMKLSAGKREMQDVAAGWWLVAGGWSFRALTARTNHQ